MSKELKEIYEKALQEKKDIIASIIPLRVKEAKILQKVDVINRKLKEVRVKIVEMEKPRLAEVSKIISTLAPKAIRFMTGE